MRIEIAEDVQRCFQRLGRQSADIEVALARCLRDGSVELEEAVHLGRRARVIWTEAEALARMIEEAVKAAAVDYALRVRAERLERERPSDVRPVEGG